MERVFTHDFGKYKAGTVADYPLPTWKTHFKGYEKFTRPLADVLTDLVLLDKRKERGNGKA